MLIDIHTHLGQIGEQVYDFERLLSYMDAAGVTEALVTHTDAVPPGRELEEVDANLACLRHCRRDGRLHPLYHVRAGNFDSNPVTFAGALERESFVGGYFGLELGPAAGEQLKRLPPYLTVLAHFRRPAVFHVSVTQPEAIDEFYRFAQSWPNQPLVLLNAGDQPLHAGLIDMAGHASRRGDALIYLDTSGTDGSALQSIIASVSAQRLVFGSNAGADPELAATVQATLSSLKDDLPPDDFAAIAHDNAVSLFGLPLPTAP